MRREKLLLIAAAGLLAGCPISPPQSQFPKVDDALARMRATYDCAIGVQGTAKVDLVTQRGRVKTEVDLFAVTPESVRFDVTVPVVGSMLYTLTSDGKDFKFADQDQKTFFFGPSRQCNLERFTRVKVPPHALVAMLRGQAPVLVHTPEQTSIAWDTDHYVLTIASKNAAEEEIHLEIPPEDFTKPWKEQRVRVTHVTVRQGGDKLYVVDLEDHKKAPMATPRVDEDGIDEPIPPSGPQCEAELPHTIRFRAPETKDDAVWEYTEVKWNPPLLVGQTFDQPKPNGMIEQRSDCEDK